MQESPVSSSPTSVNEPPPKPAPRVFVVRVEADPRRNKGQARITEKDEKNKREKLVMDVPIGRVSPRFLKGETEAFFIAELDATSGVLDLCERAPLAKTWTVVDAPAAKMLGPASTAVAKPAATAPASEPASTNEEDLCPCGAPRHKDLCRDAQIRLRGGRVSTWRAPGMENNASA